MSLTKLKFPHEAKFNALQTKLRHAFGMPSIILEHEAPHKGEPNHFVHLKIGKNTLASLPVEGAPKEGTIKVIAKPTVPKNKFTEDHNFEQEIARALKESAKKAA